MKLILSFDPMGIGRCAFTERIPLRSLGRLAIRRATSIEFNESRQRWEIKDARRHTLFRSVSRQRCVDWEQVHFHP